MRHLLRYDLWFLLWAGCGRKDLAHPWLLERCREIQDEPDGRLDLWARDHYKSTIITFGLSLMHILQSHGDSPDPAWQGREVTIGIFSHTRPIAQAFLRQLKQEMERNTLLKSLFPDILWEDTTKAVKWTEENGFSVKRRTNPKEETVEGWGIVDGQPTSKHFLINVYDDLVTKESVSTPEQIAKTTSAMYLSFNLNDSRHGVKRFIGTRYHFSDTYADMLDKRIAVPRIHPATHDGTPEGRPVFLSAAKLAEKKKEGPYIFACQQLLDPKMEGKMGFLPEWLRFYRNPPSDANIYIVVDPASSKKRESNFTAIWVMGLGTDNNYYVLDGLRDQLSMAERSDAIFRLHRQWSPIDVGYEKYGMQSDIEFLEEQMEVHSYRFNITPLSGINKFDRINSWLVPVFAQGRVWLPKRMTRVDSRAAHYDLVETFLKQEYHPYPVGIHPDMLDAMSRILDPELNALFPKRKRQSSRRAQSWSTV